MQSLSIAELHVADPSTESSTEDHSGECKHNASVESGRVQSALLSIVPVAKCCSSKGAVEPQVTSENGVDLASVINTNVKEVRVMLDQLDGTNTSWEIVVSLLDGVGVCVSTVVRVVMIVTHINYIIYYIINTYYTIIIHYLKMSATTGTPLGTSKGIPLMEQSDNARKIPQAVFIDNTEAWVEKYGGDELVAQMNELYQKYKFMEAQLIRGREGLRVKTPDIKKTLEVVRMLKEKHAKEEAMQTNFLISDNVWAKATIPNKSGKVGLWLGANVMVEYTYEEALALLERNFSNAEIRIKSTEEDLNFLKDQITTTEVNIARCYNQTVVNKQKEKAAEQ